MSFEERRAQRDAKIYAAFKVERTWEMLKAILPHYLEMFSGTDDKGIPNTNFRMAVAWATETAEHSFDMIFNTEKINEQKEPTEAHDSQETEASTETQATESSEAGQVAS